MASGQHSYDELVTGHIRTVNDPTSHPRRVILFMGAMRLLV